jgi:hypothetical protein
MRTIVHLDADAFFAAVEQASDPALRGKPVAVGGQKRGIIASASYEARKLGVYTPMPTVRARKLCPKLIVLPGDFERYEQFSRWMFGYCYDFTPDVEQTSIDEGYFDLSGARKPAIEIALTIRKAIGQRLKIIVSEGIGTNKLISSVASKLNKPAAFDAVPPGGEAAFLQPLANKWLPGVGPKTSTRLNSAGLARICHIAATPLDMLELLLGNQAAGMALTIAPSFPRASRRSPLAARKRSPATSPTRPMPRPPCAAWRTACLPPCARNTAASAPSPCASVTTTWAKTRSPTASPNRPISRPTFTGSCGRCCGGPGSGASACGWCPSDCQTFMTVVFGANWRLNPPVNSMKPTCAWPLRLTPCAVPAGDP